MIPNSRPTLPVQELKAVARGTASSLGDPSLRTVLVFETTRRAALDVVSVGQNPALDPAASSSAGAFLIVLRGRFTCYPCSEPAGGRLPRGTVATVIWSPIRGTTDFGLRDSTPRIAVASWSRDDHSHRRLAPCSVAAKLREPSGLCKRLRAREPHFARTSSLRVRHFAGTRPRSLPTAVE
jgi:hypothetical protein